MHVFLGTDEVSAHCAEYPAQVEELWRGSKRRGCRVLLPTATPALLKELLAEAWRFRAPRRLLASFDEWSAAGRLQPSRAT